VFNKLTYLLTCRPQAATFTSPFSASVYAPDSHCLAVLSRLDYGNAVMVGFPAYLFRRLQSVMNAAAHLIYGLRHSDHISDALVSLHWLRLRRECGSRRPCSCTRPLMELRRHTRVNWFVSPICLVDVPSTLLGPIVCWYCPLNCLPSAEEPSQSPDPPFATVYRTV